MEKVDSGCLKLHIDLKINDDNGVAIRSYFRSIGYYRMHISQTYYAHGIAEGFGGDWYEWHWLVGILTLGRDEREHLLMDRLGDTFLEIEAKILRHKQKLWSGGH